MLSITYFLDLVDTETPHSVPPCSVSIYPLNDDIQPRYHVEFYYEFLMTWLCYRNSIKDLWSEKLGNTRLLPTHTLLLTMHCIAGFSDNIFADVSTVELAYHRLSNAIALSR